MMCILSAALYPAAVIGLANPLWPALAGTVLVFSLLSVFMANGRSRGGDTLSRINDISTESMALDTEADPKKKKRRNSRFRSDKLRKRFRQLEDQLYDVGIELPVKDFLLYWLGTMALLTLALLVAGTPLILSALVVILVGLAPSFIISRQRNKRRAQIEDQLLDAIQVLSNALKVGYSFSQAMNNIVTEMEGPISEEFGRVFNETQHGMPLEDSLEAMCARVGSDDLSMMCMAVEIQHQVGGNLSEILMNISDTIKSRLRLKADVKVKTASGRISGLLIGSLPILLFLAFQVINPGYMVFFTSGIAGFACIGFCLVMEAIGFFVINKIITITY